MIPNFISDSLKIRNVTTENQAENFYRSIISFGKYKHPTENIIFKVQDIHSVRLCWANFYLTALFGDALPLSVDLDIHVC